MDNLDQKWLNEEKDLRSLEIISNITGGGSVALLNGSFVFVPADFQTKGISYKIKPRSIAAAKKRFGFKG